MLVNMPDELQNTSQFFRRFTIPPDPLDTQIPRPGPYLSHSIGMQNQFPHYGQVSVLPYQVPMPHVSPSTSSVASSESKNTTNEENPQPGAQTGTVAQTGQTRRQAIYLNCGGTISQSARKETALCGTPLQRSSSPFLKTTREHQATALVCSVRRASNTFRTSTNE